MGVLSYVIPEGDISIMTVYFSLVATSTLPSTSFTLVCPHMHATPPLSFSYILHQAPAPRAIIWACNVLRRSFTVLSLCMFVVYYDCLS
jgi:hypothetical protein